MNSHPTKIWYMPGIHVVVGATGLIVWCNKKVRMYILRSTTVVAPVDCNAKFFFAYTQHSVEFCCLLCVLQL